MDLPSVDLNSDDAFYALHHYLDLAAITGVPASNRVDRDRIRMILDAFVNICQPTRSDVLALSLTQTTVDRQQQLIFRLCGNEKPRATTVAYLQQLWRDLNTLAELQSTAHANRGIPDIPDPVTGRSPVVDVIQAAELEIVGKMHDDIHTFCYLKTQSRLATVQERWASFETHFLNTAATYLREGKKFGDNDDTHKLFMKTFAVLREVLRQSRSPYTSEFRNASMSVWNHVRDLGEKGFNDLAIDQLEFVVQFRKASRCMFPSPATLFAPL